MRTTTCDHRVNERLAALRRTPGHVRRAENTIPTTAAGRLARTLGTSFSGMSAKALSVGDMRERQFFRIGEVSCNLAIEEAEFDKQRGVPVSGKGLQQVFDHGPQPTYDLQIVGAARTNLTEGKMDKIFPIWRSEYQTELSRPINYFVGTQITLADRAQHAVKLIDRQHGGGRIIDRGRQCPDGDVDHDTKRKGRILIDGAF